VGTPFRRAREIVRLAFDDGHGSELRGILSKIHLYSQSRMARDLAGALKELVDETFSGIYTNADEDTSWLSNRAFAALVSGSSFKSEV
jgi:type IV secretion system protein VirD4